MEGFFQPLSLPFEKEQVLKALIRIQPHIFFVITVLKDPEEVATFRASLPARQKHFLPQGAVLWHLALSTKELEQVRSDPGLYLQPGLFELTKALEGVTTFPAQKVVPIEGAAVGFFISAEGYFVTNYHVMREEIEAAGRTAGSSDPWLCRFTSFEIPIVQEGEIVGWHPLENVILMKNLSEKEWQEGYDAALLKAEVPASGYLSPAAEGPKVGEEVWSFGFPVRSRRDPKRKEALGYEDADGSLRVSCGKILELPTDHTFVSDGDSFSGYSGAPTVNAQGQLVGFVWNVHPDVEANRRAVAFEGGTVHVAFQLILERLKGEL